MSVKDFKFVSPGVFINEIDNSFIPTSTEIQIGPVVIGRATRGLAMQPVTVQSYSEFVEMFGDTVGGGTGNDVYRDGSPQSPMYGGFAAKAFLRSNVAPLTYVRLLGQQAPDADGSAGSYAGWVTSVANPNEQPSSNGGAYGLWLFPSGAALSAVTVPANIGTGSLAATFYIDRGDIYLTGPVYGGSADASNTALTGANGVLLGRGASNDLFTLVVSGANGGVDTVKFTFDDTSEHYIRNKFNTNPTLASTVGAFYPTASAVNYWLGETYDQAIRDRGLQTGSLGVLFSIFKGSTSGSANTGPANMEQQVSREGRTGWFIGQDLGSATDFVPSTAQKLFRLIGRGHGEWLHKNCKVSIENIRRSNSNTDAYGTFSLVIRSLTDSDAAVIVMERFDGLTLDPTSPNYVARKIGDKYQEWDSVERRLKTYGDYDNLSKFVYVEMEETLDNGTADASLLPWGYYGPPRFSTIYNLQGTGSFNTGSYPGAVAAAMPDDDTTLALTNYFVTGGAGTPHNTRTIRNTFENIYLSGGAGCVTPLGNQGEEEASCTGSLVFPHVRLRVSASDGGLTNYTQAYYGMQTTRTASSNRSDPSVADFHSMLYYNYTDGGGQGANNVSGVDNYSYIFTMDDVMLGGGGSGTDFFYQSGSRTDGTSRTATNGLGQLLTDQVDRFTAPIWGGFDGFNIKKPDPLYNKGMVSTATEASSYIYHTWKRGIDTVADPDYINMNLLTAPGLTNDSLTEHEITVCEERADALALIDLPDVYLPPHEQYLANKSARLGSSVTGAVNSLRDRFIDSSYGCTFYPWVQTRDQLTGRSLWVPPSVAMMGVLASSERASELWFAPAGFNRGGLTEGAAGIPVSNVLMRLTSKDRDSLYDANINPIASFPSTGIVVFGQKTLQTRRSALDRINVRRLVIFLKKQISILSTKVLFDQNVQATWDRFKGLIEPFLNDVKTRLGITEYRLILDKSTTTPDLIDQNILYAKIMVKPARAIEYIAIDFVIASTGASFDD